MTAEVIEGEVRELAVIPMPGQAIVVSDAPSGPVDMLERASAIATALARMVEAQQLYTLIRGKKYPHVEAWQTIGRMDNVVAREAQPPVRREDGAYEAFVELIRLSDGMVIGSASALCGTADDINGRQDWSKQSEPSRRSMAVTRATSRAFRQQYAWIMALAGYQPTPAEEMPQDGAPAVTDDNGQTGTAKRTEKATSDFVLRRLEDGTRIGFRLSLNGGSFLVEAAGLLAEQLAANETAVLDQTVTVWGRYEERDFTPKGKQKVVYTVLAAERVRVPDLGDLPMREDKPEPGPDGDEDTRLVNEGITEAESEAIWRDLDSGAIG